MPPAPSIQDLLDTLRDIDADPDRHQSRSAGFLRSLEDLSDDELDTLDQQLVRRAPKGSGNECWEPEGRYLRICHPAPVESNADDTSKLKTVLQQSANEGSRFKAVGGAWGLSRLGVCRGRIIQMDKHFDFVDVDVAKKEARVGAGATFQDIARVIDGAGLAMANMPGFEQLTIGGTLSVGGLGSGMKHAAICSAVKELQMLCVNDRGNVEERVFRRGDEHFSAAVTSLGALGVITSVTLDLMPSYFLKESREPLSWHEIKVALPALLQRQRDDSPVHGALHSAEVWLSPYSDGKNCILGKRRYDRGPAKGTRPPALRKPRQPLMRFLGHLLNLFPNRRWDPLLFALEQTESDPVILPWHEGLNFGAPNWVRVLASAVAVPLDAVVSGTLVEDLSAHLQKLAKDHDQFITSPIGLRFGGASDSWMSMAHGRETCLIEIPVLIDTDSASDTLTRFVRDWTKGVKGRPHWGQFNPLSAAEISERYPVKNRREFGKAMKALDPKSVFATERIRTLRGLFTQL